MNPFSPDRREEPLPLLDVEEQRTEFRRASRRVRVPTNYCQVSDSGVATPLAISLRNLEDGEILAMGFLFDINNGGVGFVSPDILSPGDEGLLTVHYEGEPEHVHSGQVKIVNAREPQALEEEDIPLEFRGHPLTIYGTAMSEEAARGFMRFTLESLAYAHLKD